MSNDILSRLRLLDVACIGDRAPHNAFADLLEWHDRMWLVYREGLSHVSGDGRIRVLGSADGRRWEEAAVLAVDGEDLRDPKLSVMPDGRLMLLAAAAIRRDGRLAQLRNLVWHSGDGRHWGLPQEIGERGMWLWRVTWHRGVAYGVAYAVFDDPEPGRPRRHARLYRSEDGLNYRSLVERLVEGGYPNEHSMLFLPDDRALCLLRCDDQRDSALLGRAAPPYKEWSWKPLGRRFGGPHMIVLPDGGIAAAGRLYDGEVRTALCRLDPEAATLTELLSLPSGGDTSYPGLAWRHDGLWVAYYSQHEGNCRIYLARLE
ncbi:MAG: sialidase family protein [Chromatiales bacterium]|nr:sialidase family protein [Chromatiales bacterium]